MLTRLRIRNFKLFEEIDLDLGQQVVFVGPNNAGKTSALQALALWDLGRARWLPRPAARIRLTAERAAALQAEAQVLAVGGFDRGQTVAQERFEALLHGPVA